MAQWVKEPPTKPEELSLIPGSYIVEGEKQLLKAVLGPPRECPWHAARFLKIKKIEYREIKGPLIPKYYVFYLPGNWYLKASVPLAVCLQDSVPCRSIMEEAKMPTEGPQSLLWEEESQGEQRAPHTYASNLIQAH